jgi:hypothetical protein
MPRPMIPQGLTCVMVRFRTTSWQHPNTLSSDFLFGHFVWLQGKTGVSGQQPLQLRTLFLVLPRGRAGCRWASHSSSHDGVPQRRGVGRRTVTTELRKPDNVTQQRGAWRNFSSQPQLPVCPIGTRVELMCRSTSE